MTEKPPNQSPASSEERFLEALRLQYEKDGFQFVVSPRGSMLPPFLEGYVPDALAQKEGTNIAIEVKRSQSSASVGELQAIRRRFDGHPDWRLDVFYMGSSPLQSISIGASSRQAIDARVEAARALSKQGETTAAFIIGWSLLEASWRFLARNDPSKPRTPGTVLQALAMDGYIGDQTERKVRPLIELRNRIVHGDLSVAPTADDVATVLDAIGEALAN